MKQLSRFFNIEWLEKLFLWFMILFPIFDIFLFYNSFTTLIRIFIVFLFLGMLLIVCPESRKRFRYLFLYGIIVFVYFLFHHFHALDFKSLVPGNFDYSIVREFLYVLKMSMPVVFVFVLYHLRWESKCYFKVLKWWIFIIAGSIIITNLFQISLGSYSDQVILGNIFDWFFLSRNGLSYYDLASKGFFMYANQISTICVMLLIVCSYFCFREKTFISKIMLAILSLSMVMLGTRVASVGGLLILFVCLFSYLFFQVIRKKKIDFAMTGFTLFVIGGWAILLPFSPCMNRGQVMNDIYHEDEVALVYAAELVGNDIDKLTYIEQNYEKKRIANEFIYDNYPYQYDPDFWYDIMQLPVEKRVDYRFLEISMVERVVNINDNPNDKWFGITNTRVQNIFNIERDFVLQYYSFGIIGCVLFLGIYLIFFGIGFYYFIKKFDWLSTLTVFLIGCFLLCCYASGNNLNHLSVMFPASFLIVVMFHLSNRCEKTVKN